MKVKCKSLVESNGKPVESSPWLTIGNEYYVLGVLRDKNNNTNFQIVTNERESVNSLGYFPAYCFDTVSHYRPSNWKERIVKGSATEISPASWQSDGCWEAFYDGDPKAQSIFEKERNLIVSEEP
jgi:hypothetical protein